MDSRRKIIVAIFSLLIPFSSFAEALTPVLINRSISAHSGDLLQTETDLKIPDPSTGSGHSRGPSTGSGHGLDFEFTRTYRSRITYEGPLGFN